MDLKQKARQIAARMMLAGDDGSWAGELDYVKVYENGISILTENLRSLRNETIEEAANVADKMGGEFIEQDLEGMAYCEAKRDIAHFIRALKET